jgi:1-deoxy-D-xylulose-5-phosphate reductoisomerase
MSESKKKRISLLGCTGSIGKNVLDVVRQQKDHFEIRALACGRSIDQLMRQIEEFQPQFVSVSSEAGAQEVRKELKGLKIPVFFGPEGHRRLVEESEPDIVIAAMTGTFGLQACLQAIKQKVSILGVANKEVLVMAGDFIRAALQESSTRLIPIDSEHSAIFQVIDGRNRSFLKRIILTASGGPFRTLPADQFKRISVEQALQHPNWSMGEKITVDSATLMNKGLEFIEAMQLFQVSKKEIEVVVHPQSIVHSMVEFWDGSILAQLGLSDMRIPISYALGYPDRIELNLGGSLDFSKMKSLDFESPDLEKFPCLRLAIDSLDQGRSGPIVLNAANEICVEAFLKRKIDFIEIPDLIENAMTNFSHSDPQCLEDVVELDFQVKNWTLQKVEGRNQIKVIL